MSKSRGTGARPSPEDSRDFKFGSIGIGASGDPSLESDLTKYVKVVRDQRSTNSCGGQAFAGAIDILTAQSIHAADYGVASALFLYYMAVRSWGAGMIDAGIDARSVARVLKKQGCCDESEWPFNAKKVLVAPNWNAIFRGAARSGCSYAFVREALRLGKLASALHVEYPIVVGLDLERSFFDVSSSETIELPKGKIIGRHFVLLIGRKSDRFKILNSWGESWGDGGFGWLSDEYVESTKCWDPCVVHGFDRLEQGEQTS